jgi:Phage terminase, small subunit
MPRLPVPKGRGTLAEMHAAKRAKGQVCTKRQEAFCQEYMKDFNKLRAYLAAGYTSENARVTAYRVFNKPVVQARLAQLQRDRAMKNEVTIQQVISSLHRIAESAEGEGKYAAAIRAFELLGKHLGMFIDRTEATVKHELNADVEQVEREIARLVDVAFGNEQKHLPCKDSDVPDANS